MEEEKKLSKKSVFSIVVIVFALLIASFSVGVGFAKNYNNFNKQISSSYAVGDVSDGTFISSNFYVPMKYCHGLYSNYYAFGYEDDSTVVSLRFSLSYSSLDDTYTFGLLDKSYFAGDYNYSNFTYIYWGLTNSSLTGQNMPYYHVVDNSNPNYFLKNFNSGTQIGFMFSINVDSGFDTSNVIGVSIGKQKNVDTFIEFEAYDEDSNIYHSFGLIEFSYFDINGKHFNIQACGVMNSVIDLFIERTYYFDRDNQGYDYGYSIGSQEGHDAGYQEGYTTGYNRGYNIGDSAGYNRGVMDSNDYTFLGLFGAVVDAPISMFKGLFDFSVFGTNMGQFLLSLASITLVLVIVRFVLARKE